MLQFFEWFWKAVGVADAFGLAEGESFQGFLYFAPSPVLFYGGIFLIVVLAYLLGSLNGAIIVSKCVFHDDIRDHGSGNAGLTNMGRVFGKKGVWPTLVIDIVKQFLAVTLGIVLMGEIGAYLAGLFCMVGHIAPVFFHFKGGKGVLTAGVMILLIDYQVFLIDFALFALVVLISRYVSLGSVVAGFALPGVVWLSSSIRGTVPHPFALFFAVLIGLMLILMHRTNIKRLYEGTENKLSFKRKKKDDPEGDEAKQTDAVDEGKKKKKK